MFPKLFTVCNRCKTLIGVPIRFYAKKSLMSFEELVLFTYSYTCVARIPRDTRDCAFVVCSCPWSLGSLRSRTCPSPTASLPAPEVGIRAGTGHSPPNMDYPGEWW